jgi:hypothetical protein
MKWYFALNEASLHNHRAMWESMILTALRSCRQHTDLEPHFIFDGGSDPFVSRLEAEGVTVIRHRVSFWDAIAAYRQDEPYRRVAGGAFLRVDIPALNTDDEFVLYTDCDVLFIRPIELSGLEPATFACAPEFHVDDPDDLNSGVMLMNLPALRADLTEFRAFIAANLADLPVFDQTAYRLFYGGRSDPLPLCYNWRPYWGMSEEARIVHFHGPKPHDVLQMLLDRDTPTNPAHRLLFDQDRQGYRHFLGQWLEVAGETSTWM